MKKIIKFFLFGIFVLTIATIVLIFYAKENIKNLDYDEYLKNGQYTLIAKDQYNLVFNLEDFFIDDKVESLKDLEDLSDYILIVKVSQNPTFIGRGILNNCTIKKVLKGNNVEEGMSIPIYDLIAEWGNDSVLYLDGSTPLEVGNEYLVFLKNATNATVKNAFVYSSIKYGHFNANLNANDVLTGYDYTPLKILEASKYNYIFANEIFTGETSEEVLQENMDIQIKKYNKISADVYEKYFNSNS